MNITFVSPRTEIYPPIGLCSVSAYLKNRRPGTVTSLVEVPPATPVEKTVERILATRPVLVGITTYTVGFHLVIELCRAVRRMAPQLPLVLGGPHITSLPGSLPPEAGAGVIGEGEETFRALCELVSERGELVSGDLSGIPGLCHHADGGVAITAPTGSCTNRRSSAAASCRVCSGWAGNTCSRSTTALEREGGGR